MADSVIQTPSRSGGQPQVQRGPIARLLNGLVNFVIWLVLGLFGNILMELLGLGFIWPEEGPQHSIQTLESEIRYIREDVTDSFFTAHPAALAASIVAKGNDYLFKRTGIVLAVKAMNRQQNLDVASTEATKPFSRLIRRNTGNLRDCLIAGMAATQVYFLRLSVLFLSLPVFFIAALIGAVDGMVQRDLNRMQGGRELGQRYHLAKGLVGPALSLPWILYLAWPSTIHPYVIILPFAVFSGIIMAITTATFKKYF